MQTARMMLAVVGAGTLLGTMAGVAIDPTMLAAPEPAWRKLVAREMPSNASYRLVESAPENLSPVADPPIYIPALADLRASRMHFDVVYIPEPAAEPVPEAPADAGWSDDRGLAAVEDAAAARNAAEDARAAMPAGGLPAANAPAPPPEPALPEPAPIEVPRVPRPMAVTLSG